MTTEIEAGMPTGIVSYINERAANMVRFSDKLSEALNKIDDYFEEVGPKAGIRFTDTDVFFTEYKDQIGKIQYKLMVCKEWGLYASPDCEYIDSVIVAGGSRAIKKAAVIRLPEFLRLYAETLKRYEKEYEDISEKATRIAEILHA